MKITLTEIDSTIERSNKWTRYRDVTQIMGIALHIHDDGRKASGVLFLMGHGERYFEPQFPNPNWCFAPPSARTLAG